MKIIKTAVITKNKGFEDQANDIDSDMNNLFLFTHGRVRFGDGVSAARGENMSGEFRQFTTSGTPNMENAISHGLGSIPIGYIILWQNLAGSLYQGPTTGTAWTSSLLYLKCSVASVTFNVFLLK